MPGFGAGSTQLGHGSSSMERCALLGRIPDIPDMYGACSLGRGREAPIPGTELCILSSWRSSHRHAALLLTEPVVRIHLKTSDTVRYYLLSDNCSEKVGLYVNICVNICGMALHSSCKIACPYVCFVCVRAGRPCVCVCVCVSVSPRLLCACICACLVWTCFMYICVCMHTFLPSSPRVCGTAP